MKPCCRLTYPRKPLMGYLPRAPRFSREQSAFTVPASHLLLTSCPLSQMATREKKYNSFWDSNSTFRDGSSDLQPPSYQL